jgi:uncharacterized protein YqeY
LLLQKTEYNDVDQTEQGIVMIEKLKEDMKSAMKAGEKERLSTIRMLISDVKNAQIQKGGVGTELQENDYIAILKTNLKKRLDAAQSYRDGGREEQAEKEEAEAKIIQEYLPKALGEDELEKAVDKAIAESGATSMREMGAVMKIIMSEHAGAVDGKKVQQLVQKKLG